MKNDSWVYILLGGFFGLFMGWLSIEAKKEQFELYYNKVYTEKLEQRYIWKSHRLAMYSAICFECIHTVHKYKSSRTDWERNPISRKIID